MRFRPFEIVLIAIFAITAIGGLIALKMYKGEKDVADQIYGKRVVVWGTFDAGIMTSFLSDRARSDKALTVVEYIKKDPRSFDGELVNAIAEGRSPDLIILPHTKLVSLRSKLYPIPYETISERTFRDTYVDGAEIFMRSDGVYGVPFAIDPLVLYWNRDIFSSGGLATPPKTWENLMAQTVPALVRRDESFTITQSAIALGEFANIVYAKEIIAMLFLQAGNPLVTETEAGYRIVMDAVVDDTPPVSDAVVSFYTQFASPLSNLYTWNRSLKQDRAQFLGGTLGMYIGFASDLDALRRDNPNLNFDIALVPQGSGVTVTRSYGTVYAFAIPRASKNIKGAYTLAQTLTSVHGSALTALFRMSPTVRRLHGEETETYQKIINQSALIARGWLEPSPAETTAAFKSMIEEVTAGRKRVRNSVQDTTDALKLLFR